MRVGIETVTDDRETVSAITCIDITCPTCGAVLSLADDVVPGQRTVRDVD